MIIIITIIIIIIIIIIIKTIIIYLFSVYQHCFQNILMSENRPAQELSNKKYVIIR